MSEIMLDLETLGTRPNSVILVLSAIKFDRSNKINGDVDSKTLDKLDVFYERICIDSCLNRGMEIDESTMKWWSNQKNDVLWEALKNPDRKQIEDVLIEFKRWIGISDILIWGNGSSFDCGILAECYKKCDMKVPWKFWNERDLRTILELSDISLRDVSSNNLHNAKYDCLRQIIALQRAYRYLES